jgi:hypothetical protein
MKVEPRVPLERLKQTHGRKSNGRASGVSIEDFYAYMPMHAYIYIPTRELWPAASVNARIAPIGKEAANRWLDQNRPVEQMTWSPGMPMLIRDQLISQGGWVHHDKATCFNLYREPLIEPGDASEAYLWVDHVERVYPDDCSCIIRWLACRVQRPADKINHALVLGGAQGIGKDTLLEPVKHAIGPWNFHEVSPQNLLGRFNGFAKSVILRVNEARDLGDVNRYQFYDHLKSYTAAPPDVLRVDEKHLREYSVPNICGVVITTNHKTDGIYLPADDRRHYVAWSDRTKTDFSPDYWNKLWRWYDNGGCRHVASYLAALDLSTFDPKAPPPKTEAFWEVVNANRAPEDAELADALDALKNPDAVILTQIIGKASGSLADWLLERKNRRVIPHRLESVGYVPVRNDAADDGLWKITDRRQAIYAKAKLSLRERLKAASDLVARQSNR